MITLYSYPGLFGVADNNGYGLKVLAFLKLRHLACIHEHIFETSSAPRGQIPYLVDGARTVGDSDTTIAHLEAHHAFPVAAALIPDAMLTRTRRDTNHPISRLLDDLYWVMSYSRWKAERFWPQFRDGLLTQHPSLTEEGLLKVRESNFRRYHYQGIGRFAPEAAYARGLADLQVLAHLIPQSGYLHGARPCSADAALYGFIANILFYPIETSLKQFVDAQEKLVRHCREIHRTIGPSR